MNKVVNGKSIFENTLDVISILSEENQIGFERFSKRKRTTPKYFKLFRKLINAVNEKTAFDDGAETLFRDEHDGGAKAFEALLNDLYTNLLNYLVEENEKTQAVSWRIELNNYLNEAEVLWKHSCPR